MDKKNNDKKTIKNKAYDKKIIKPWKQVIVILMVYDLFCVTASYFTALLIRFEFRFSGIPIRYIEAWTKFAPVYAVFCLVVFWALRLYKSIWRFASFMELKRVTMASIITCIFHTIVITFLVLRMPITYYVIGALLQYISITGIRFAYRFILLLRSNQGGKENTRVMLIGGGAAGQVLLREMHRAEEVDEKVVCIIDDNRNKWNREIDGVPIVGLDCIIGAYQGII